MPKQYRKRKAEEEEEEEDAGAEEEGVVPPEVLRARLEDTRRLQQERARARGVEAARLAGLAAEGAGAGRGGDEEGDEDADGLRQSFFAEQRLQEGEEDPQMLKYIEAELAKRRGAAGGDGAKAGGRSAGTVAEGAAGRLAAAAAALYDTPAELRVPQPGEGDADEDGADRWLTGIVEVQLPVEYKLQNIEETERAKAALLAAQRARADAAQRGEGGAAVGGAPLAVGGEFARFMAPRSMLAQPAARGMDRPGGNVASDDIVAKRFMQAERRRAQRR